MQVSNNYELLNSYQKPSILPIVLPDYTNKEIYKASDGNVVRGTDGQLHLTPQAKTYLKNLKEDVQNEEQAKKEQEQASAREFVTGVMKAQSTKTQVEIYLAVATDGKYDSGDGLSTAEIVNTLRDIQKQNDFVQAYALYAQNQKAKPTLY